jgi:hypothetical protein
MMIYYINQKKLSIIKLKFITTNHIDLVKQKDRYNFFGMTTRNELFVPVVKKLTHYSNLLGQSNIYYVLL